MHHSLLGRLRGDAAKISRRHFHFDGVPDVDVRFDLTRFRKFDLILWITDVIDDHQVGERTDFAGFRVDIDAQVARRADALFRGREQGVRDRLEQDFAFDPALPL